MYFIGYYIKPAYTVADSEVFEYPAHSQIQNIQTVAGGSFVILHYVM